ncbi:MAG TPA: hypothetical protein DCZ10_11235 [Pelotomaculum sp.]|nr:hypothetical protein [Pelotomaculum sp.]
MKNKWILNSFVIITIFILIFAMEKTFMEIRRVNEEPLIETLKISLLGFIFGIIIEWQNLQIFKKPFKINLLIIPAIILTIISFVPRSYWAFFSISNEYFGWLLAPLMFSEIHLVLNILAGILLVRSFVNSKENSTIIK